MRRLSLMACCVTSFAFFVYCSSSQGAVAVKSGRQNPPPLDATAFLKAIEGNWWGTIPDVRYIFDADGNGVLKNIGQDEYLRYMEPVAVGDMIGVIYHIQGTPNNDEKYVVLFMKDGLLCRLDYESSLVEAKNTVIGVDTSDKNSWTLFAIPDNKTSSEARDFIALIQGVWNEVDTVEEAMDNVLTVGADGYGILKRKYMTGPRDCRVEFMSCLLIDTITAGVFRTEVATTDMYIVLHVNNTNQLCAETHSNGIQTFLNIGAALSDFSRGSINVVATKQ